MTPTPCPACEGGDEGLSSSRGLPNAGAQVASHTAGEIIAALNLGSADGVHSANAPLYYSVGLDVHKRPVLHTGPSGSRSIEMGFRALTVADALEDAGAAVVADMLCRAEMHEELLKALQASEAALAYVELAALDALAGAELADIRKRREANCAAIAKALGQ